VAAIIPPGTAVWGLQLPIQSQSRVYVQDWESGCGPPELADIARAADRAGAFYVGVCDHVAIPGPAVEAMSPVWYDTVATLSWLAALTDRVHLLSHVYVLPYRHPLVVAKAFATLDHLSGGRAILGVGAGHLEAEFRLLGADFGDRGRAVERSIPVLRAVFAEEVPTVGGPGAEAGLGVAPRPARPGGPPVWVGGSSPAAIRRAARLGDGWLPQGPPAMGMRRAIEVIRAERERAGRPEPFDLGVNCEPVHVGDPAFEVPEHTAAGAPEQVAERLRRYPALGVNQLQVRFVARSAAEYCDQLERFGAEVWPLVT
jgi:probable F420-dependent oxidoreductase